MAGRARIWVAVAAVLLFVVATGSGAGADDRSRYAIHDLVEAPAVPRFDGRPLDRAALIRFYRPRHYAPAWEDGERVAPFVRALAAADAHGLDPARYHLDALRARAGRAAVWTVETELLLTDAFVRYASDVRAGRRSAGYQEPDWGIAATPFDAVSTLERALLEPAARWPGLLDSLPPPAPEYGRLVEALRRYRAIVARGGWPAMPAGPALRPGADDVRVALLRARLAAEEERPSAGAETGYDGALEVAVRRFQARHGLRIDGIVGPETIRALDVPATDRVRQIVLNLERWRWLPRELGPHHVTVNAADATLRVVREGRTVFESRVVVGDVRHPTPVVQARMEAVVLNPSWSVPASIAVAEILPRVRENGRYLAENHIVILERRGADPYGLEVDWAAIPAESLPFRLQQQPGADNPLGRIKFDLPNRFDVYLHDTPLRSLFGEPVRTGSHGCVRVERAAALARYALADGTAGWTGERLAAAIASGRTSRIALARPLPVYNLYWTAFVDADGSAQFRHDVYGRDSRLADRLDPGAGSEIP